MHMLRGQHAKLSEVAEIPDTPDGLSADAARPKWAVLAIAKAKAMKSLELSAMKSQVTTCSRPTGSARSGSAGGGSASGGGQPAAAGQPAAVGQPVAAGQPAAVGQPAAAGQPAVVGLPAVVGQPGPRLMCTMLTLWWMPRWGLKLRLPRLSTRSI